MPIDALLVGSGDHAQRAVVLVRVVEVNANGKHLFEQRKRWLHSKLIVLGRPVRKARAIELFVNRDGQVLVPGDEPIGSFRFVEIDGFDDEVIGAEMVPDQGPEVGVENGGLDLRYFFKELPDGEKVISFAEGWSGGASMADELGKRVYFLEGEDFLEDVVTSFIKLFGIHALNLLIFRKRSDFQCTIYSTVYPSLQDCRPHHNISIPPPKHRPAAYRYTLLFHSHNKMLPPRSFYRQ